MAPPKGGAFDFTAQPTSASSKFSPQPVVIHLFHKSQPRPIFSPTVASSNPDLNVVPFYRVTAVMAWNAFGVDLTLVQT
ncbi:MAG: hypothetical protein WBD45_15725 [Terriglobales bacterium]